jgi:anti-sigma regulatory factor (Ser/Thr protein kinase)
MNLEDDRSAYARVTPVKRTVIDTADGKPQTVFDCLAIDNSWEAYSKESRAGRKPLVIDLSEVTYIAHDCLLYLGALIRWRQLKSRKTIIELPRVERVIDFLKAWKFPEFMEHASGLKFEQLVTESSFLWYSKCSNQLAESVHVISTPSGGLEELLPVDHFAITPIRLESDPSQSASIEQDKWLESHVRSVLDQYFDRKGERIATRVILEAVLNAASHSGATMAFTSSQFSPKTVSSDGVIRPPKLEIAVWDDGDPIADTLKNAMTDGLDIKSEAFGVVDEHFHVKLVRTKGPDQIKVLNKEDPGTEYGFPWLTVSAFLAGITSRPRVGVVPSTQTSELKDPFDSIPMELRDRGGLGLHFIRRHVIDLFRGRIRYLCADYRMTMNSSYEPTVYDYDVTIQSRPNRSWPLKGNLMILELPVNRG